jgi:3-hydroxyisobutyrate dehydrogenase-like beta-hydroxyacid dehydrogenase
MMTIFAAFFGGIGWRGWFGLAMAGALLTAIYMVRSADREAGAAKERARMERANRAAGDAADQAERRVLDCPSGRWNREVGRCE